MNNRKEHAQDRRDYEAENPYCEYKGSKCRTFTATTHHIVQLAASTYELKANYLGVCDFCHSEIHATNGRKRCIDIKIRKGEWLTEDEQREVFGKFYG